MERAGDISPALWLVTVFRAPTVFASGGWVSDAGVTDAGVTDAGSNGRRAHDRSPLPGPGNGSRRCGSLEVGRGMPRPYGSCVNTSATLTAMRGVSVGAWSVAGVAAVGDLIFHVGAYADEGGGSFANGGGHLLGAAGAGVASGENAVAAGFHW